MNRVWFNGGLVDGPLAVDPRERGLLLGDGLFETMAVIGGKPVWLGAHLDRLAAAAAELGIAFNRSLIEAAVTTVLGGSQPPFAALRITLTRGPAGRGLAGDGDLPGLLVSLADMPTSALFEPVRLATSTIRRNTFAPSSRLKTLSYVDAIAAARDAARRGADDALMLNTEGHAASSTIANLFMLRGNRLVTPDLSQAILPGIARAVVLRLAPRAGLAVEERSIAPSELLAANATFLTNSLRLIRPVTHLDGQPLGEATIDPLRDLLCCDVERDAGIDPRSI